MPRAKQSATKRGKSSRSVVVRQVAVRKRLTPELRRQQILDAAARLAVRQGFLPLAIEPLAQDAGASKALIYTYFPTQFDIANELLKRELSNLTVAGLQTALHVNDWDQATLLSAMLYFEHVAQYGPLLHILITDLYMADHFDPLLVERGRLIMQQLVNLGRAALPLSDTAIRASIEMLTAIPEESGSLAFYKELEPATARRLCHTLMLSSLDALRTGARAGDGA